MNKSTVNTEQKIELNQDITKKKQLKKYEDILKQVIISFKFIKRPKKHLKKKQSKILKIKQHYLLLFQCQYNCEETKIYSKK